MSQTKKSVILFLLIASCFGYAAELSVARIFSSNMVLQRNTTVKIWGNGTPGQKVKLTFGKIRKAGKVVKSGKWTVTLPRMKANATGQEMTISSGDKQVVLKDVVIGDVWFCCGQSNMRWMVKQSTGAKQEMQTKNSNIRMLDFTTNLYPNNAAFPVKRLEELDKDPSSYYQTKGWQSATKPDAIGNFSAVAFFFGEKLQKDLKIPIGLIHTAVGGTTTECYISKETLQKNRQLKSLAEDWLNNENYSAWCRKIAATNLKAWKAAGKTETAHHPFEPGFLFDAGIRPLLSCNITGVIWYQGESNCPTNEKEEYTGGYDLELSRLKFHTLINDWRKQWRDLNLPFLYVQLPGIKRNWVPYREMQQDTLKKIKYTGMAVTYDLGHPTNVHPPNKKPVGQRLALIALGKVYKKRDVVYSGPVYKKAKAKGKKFIVEFDDVKKGQKVLAQLSGAKEIDGFELAEKDGEFVRGDAKVVKETIEVTAPGIEKPKYIRYGWFNDPKGKATLGNKAGLPALPFINKKVR